MGKRAFIVLMLMGPAVMVSAQKKAAATAAPGSSSASLHARLRIVAADGSGEYRTVQAALNDVPSNSKEEIFISIKRGVYREKLHLDSTKINVTLTGEGAFNTILTYDDHPGMVNPQGDSINTRNSYSFRILGDNFTARNIGFRNDAGFTAGQAVALEVQGEHARFYNCNVIGNQDILFLNNPNSTQYYKDCYIEGTTDFIFGAATAWFENCHIHSKKNSHVTAASTPQEHRFGFVFDRCVLTGDTSIHNASLGRPWRPFASVIYLDCYMDRHIRPDGWSNWNNTDSYKTARYAEYRSYGPGGSPSGRVSWARQLTDKEAENINVMMVLGWFPEPIWDK